MIWWCMPLPSSLIVKEYKPCADWSKVAAAYSTTLNVSVCHFLADSWILLSLRPCSPSVCGLHERRSVAPCIVGINKQEFGSFPWWKHTGFLDIHTTRASLSAPIGPFYSQSPLSSGQLPPSSQVDNSVELLSRTAQVFSENHRPGSPLPQPCLSLKNPDLPGLRGLET